MPKILAPLSINSITKAISEVKSGKKPNAEIFDGAVPGLHLRIGMRESKWTVMLGAKATRTRVPLGVYPAVPLSEARKLASQKIDAYRSVKMSTAASLGGTSYPPTLEGLIELYGASVGHKLRTWDESLRAMNRVFPALMSERLVRLEMVHVQRAADNYPSATCGAQAIRCIRPILKWAKKRGYILFSPLELEQPRIDHTPRNRVLSDEELRDVLRSLGTSDYDNAMRLILWTACRKNEVANARWEEFDLDKGLWTIPRTRMKTNNTHTIPLPTAALNMIKSLPLTSGVIWGSKLSNWDRYQKQLFKKSGTSGWHRHDLRRTAATILGKLSYEPHVIEAVLAHVNIYSRLAATYNHHRYEKEHRAALESLQEYYSKLLT